MISLHIGKSKVKVSIEITIRSLKNPPKNSQGKELYIAWKRGDKPDSKGETQPKPYQDVKMGFGDVFTCRCSLWYDKKTDKFEAKKMAFALYEVSGGKKTVLNKQDINVADYGKHGFNEARLVCLGKNTAKDPTLEVAFHTTWESEPKTPRDTPVSTQTHLDTGDKDRLEQSVDDRTNLDFSEDGEHSSVSPRQANATNPRGSSGSRAPAPNLPTDKGELSRSTSQSRSRSLTSSGSDTAGGKQRSSTMLGKKDSSPTIQIDGDGSAIGKVTGAVTSVAGAIVSTPGALVSGAVSGAGSVANTLSGKDKRRVAFRITFTGVENLSGSARGHYFYIKWRVGKKDNQAGDTNEYLCESGSLTFSETIQFACHLWKKKNASKCEKRLISFQLREVVSGGSDTQAVKFDIDVAAFVDHEEDPFHYTAKKSNSLPALSMEISTKNVAESELISPRGSRTNSEIDSELQLSDGEDEDKSKVFEEGEKEREKEREREKEKEKEVRVDDTPTPAFNSFSGRSYTEYNTATFKKTPDFTFKAIVLGDSGVGKTNILNRYSGLKFDKNTISTIGVNLFNKTYVKNDDQKVVNMAVWDTAGQERFKSITKGYYRGSHAVVLVYDLTDRKTFEHLNNWANEVKESNDGHIEWIIIGNKSDLGRKEVPTSAVSEFAKTLGASYLEASAITNQNIHEAFEMLVEELMSGHKGISGGSEGGPLPSSTALQLQSEPEDDEGCAC